MREIKTTRSRWPLVDTELEQLLHDWLVQPLSVEQKSALAAACHFVAAASDPLATEARRIVLSNSNLPHNFLDSLDACRLVEMRLSNDQQRRYIRLISDKLGNHPASMILAMASTRARVLCQVLGLKRDGKRDKEKEFIKEVPA